MILDGQAAEKDIIGKDTESYFTILYQGKSNRWLLRYWGDRNKPLLNFQIPLNDHHKESIARAGLEMNPGGNILIGKPENLVKLSSLVMDCLSYCQENENFKIKKQ
jgi:hypothetical protein